MLVEYLQRLEYRCVDGVVVGIEAVVLQFRVAADVGTQQGAQPAAVPNRDGALLLITNIIQSFRNFFKPFKFAAAEIIPAKIQIL